MSAKSTNRAVFRFVSISFSVLILLVIFIGVFKASTFCYNFGYRIFTEQPMEAEPGTEVVVQVDTDDSALAIGKMLEEKGLVRDPYLYVAQYYLSAYVNDILPGTYTLNTSMTTKEMLIVMSTAEEDTEVESEQ